MGPRSRATTREATWPTRQGKSIKGAPGLHRPHAVPARSVSEVYSAVRFIRTDRSDEPASLGEPRHTPLRVPAWPGLPGPTSSFISDGDRVLAPGDTSNLRRPIIPSGLSTWASEGATVTVRGGRKVLRSVARVNLCVTSRDRM